jgi:glucosamine--fructose-6-phosphate aminotransferase (isomerizing)
VIGISADGNLVSSDSSAILPHTKKVVYLDDYEMAVIEADSYRVLDNKGDKLNKKLEAIEGDAESVKKAGFDHFMLKEIFESPEVIKNTIRGRLIPKAGQVKLGGLEAKLNDLDKLSRLTIVGCGSAYYAGLVGKYMLEEYANLPTDIELGSEYRYRQNAKDPLTAVLAVTQSGETADTLASVRLAKQSGLLTMGMVNVVGSTIARETDVGVYNHIGPEVAVASTKAFLSQLTVFVLLAILIGRNRTLTEAEAMKILEDLYHLPDIIANYLQNIESIKSVAKKYSHYQNAIYIGRNSHYPIAYEGALKLKEVTYIHAEAYAGGELKHGPIALLDENFPVIALAPDNSVYPKMLSNIEEVKARKAPVLAITTDGNNSLDNLADDVLLVPKVHPILQPIITTIPLQLLSYYIGVERGLNVDRPRNLAKSVTVE